jgi:hypothetical protein
MNIHEIITEKENIDEAPVGLLKQVGRKIGAKAAGAVGMKGTAAKLGGSAEVGDEARQLKVALQGYAGKTGINMKQMQGPQLAAFLKSKGYPNMHLKGVQGIMTPKQIDQAIMTAAQDAAKADGDPTVGSTQSAPGVDTAPAQQDANNDGKDDKTGKPIQKQPAQQDANNDGKDDKTGKPIQKQPAQKAAPVDKNKDGKDDNTGNVIPMKKPGATKIPPKMQQQINALTSGEKQQLVGLLK